MGYETNWANVGSIELRQKVQRLVSEDRPRFRRLWMYYRNPMRVWAGVANGVAGMAESGADRPYRQAQEWGLPSRITGVRSGVDPFLGQMVPAVARKEVVIENDIAWRIDTMIDYLFGQPLIIESAVQENSRREEITKLIRLVLQENGGMVFLQQMALLGAVYGFVDVLVKLDTDALKIAKTQATADADLATTDAEQPAADGEGVDGAGDESEEQIRTEGGSAVAAASGGAAAGGSGGEASGRPAPGKQSEGSVASERSEVSATDTGARKNSRDDALERIARLVRFEIVEPARALPLIDANDWRNVTGYVQVYEVGSSGINSAKGQGTPGGQSNVGAWLAKLVGTAQGMLFARAYEQPLVSLNTDCTRVTEVLTADQWQRYENEKLVADGKNSLGVIPLAHVQNVALPFEYSGVSDVEPLIPLQDELNTRISDRAYRISMQSFKMYLGIGIENFLELPVGPGRMFVTDNEQATIQEFGGDAAVPSEEDHIEDIREAMDKASAVSPIAAGTIKENVGRLTSAAALRVTLQALLAKTEKKRTTYGAAIQKMMELALAWLDVAGVFKTDPNERAVELHWASPIPENDLQALQEAQAKVTLGVPQEVVLRELGY